MMILGDGYSPAMHNKTNSTFHFGQNFIEFFAVDQPHKARGPRRDYLFINEANNVRKSTYDSLEVRTKEKIFIDFNPVEHFWAHDLIGQPDTGFFVSTYLDNDQLSPNIIRSIESRREKDPNWWHVYGKGQIGKIEGLVFPRFEQVDAMPDIPADLGLDFGYTNDPTTLIETSIQGEDIFMNELLYRRELTNQDIVRELARLKIRKDELVFADCAEPKSIEEIHREGYNIQPCIKGRDSIYIGTDFIKRYNIKVTKHSTNLIKELRNYRYMENKDGDFLNDPVDNWNNCIDAARYSLSQKIEGLSEIELYKTDVY